MDNDVLEDLDMISPPSLKWEEENKEMVKQLDKIIFKNPDFDSTIVKSNSLNSSKKYRNVIKSILINFFTPIEIVEDLQQNDNYIFGEISNSLTNSKITEQVINEDDLFVNDNKESKQLKFSVDKKKIAKFQKFSWYWLAYCEFFKVLKSNREISQKKIIAVGDNLNSFLDQNNSIYLVLNGVEHSLNLRKNIFVDGRYFYGKECFVFLFSEYVIKLFSNEDTVSVFERIRYLVRKNINNFAKKINSIISIPLKMGIVNSRLMYSICKFEKGKSLQELISIKKIEISRIDKFISRFEKVQPFLQSWGVKFKDLHLDNLIYKEDLSICIIDQGCLYNPDPQKRKKKDDPLRFIKDATIEFKRDGSIITEGRRLRHEKSVDYMEIEESDVDEENDDEEVDFEDDNEEDYDSINEEYGNDCSDEIDDDDSYNGDECDTMNIEINNISNWVEVVEKIPLLNEENFNSKFMSKILPDLFQMTDDFIISLKQESVKEINNTHCPQCNNSGKDRFNFEIAKILKQENVYFADTIKGCCDRFGINCSCIKQFSHNPGKYFNKIKYSKAHRRGKIFFFKN